MVDDNIRNQYLLGLLLLSYEDFGKRGEMIEGEGLKMIEIEWRRREMSFECRFFCIVVVIRSL